MDTVIKLGGVSPLTLLGCVNAVMNPNYSHCLWCVVMVINLILLGCFKGQWQSLVVLVHGEYTACHSSFSRFLLSFMINIFVHWWALALYHNHFVPRIKSVPWPVLLFMVTNPILLGCLTVVTNQAVLVHGKHLYAVYYLSISFHSFTNFSP